MGLGYRRAVSMHMGEVTFVQWVSYSPGKKLVRYKEGVSETLSCLIYTSS